MHPEAANVITVEQYAGKAQRATLPRIIELSRFGLRADQSLEV